MSRKSIQADIDNLYERMDQQQRAVDSTYRDVKDIKRALEKGPVVSGHVEHSVAPWVVKFDLLSLYEGNIDQAQSAYDWLLGEPGEAEGPVEDAAEGTTGEVPA